MRLAWCALALTSAGLGGAVSAHAATLPQHDPVRVVIVSDEVNPNGLSDAELTQPGDLRAALNTAGNGLNIASLLEVDSDCVDEGLTSLSAGTDVFIYFAHVSATRCDGSDAQGELTQAVQAHLQAGGGVVVFHHGIYAAPGKEAILSLLGATAGAIDWQPDNGQRVIGTDAAHFVANNGLTFSESRTIGNAPGGVSAGDYPAFLNVPDERYPGLTLLTAPGEERTTLFVTDSGDALDVLGYDLRRPDWAGHVVLYQPGEWQPQALDDLQGNNFQILANAIHYVATTQDTPGEGGTDDGPTDDGAVDTGTGGGADAGMASADDAAVDDTAGGGDGPAGSDGTVGGSGNGDGTGGAAGQDEASGCSCRADSAPVSAWLLGIAMLGFRRRRASR